MDNADHAFWNITDFDAKCEKCETINRITLKDGELKKQEPTGNGNYQSTYFIGSRKQNNT